MIKLEQIQTRPSTTVPFYYETLTTEELQLLDSLISASPYIISFTHTVAEDGLSVVTTRITEDPTAEQIYHAENSVLKHYNSAAVAYNLVNRIISMYSTTTI